MEEDINKIEELRDQIWNLEDELSELNSKLDKAYAEGLYNLVGKYFKGSHYNIFEIFKVYNVYKLDGAYKLQTTYLKYSISDFRANNYFLYCNTYDIPLGCDEKESFDELDLHYDEISKEEFNSLLKEAFKKYSNKMINETI